MLYFGKSVNVYVQSDSDVAVVLATSVPSAYSLTVTDSGRIPSWLLLSFQVFVPVMLVVSGSCVLVIVNPSTLVVYPVTGVSFTVYTIAFPSLFLSRSVNVYFQFVLAVATAVFTFSPSAYRVIVTLSGLIPSWLLLSFQIFSPSIVIFSGLVRVFSIVQAVFLHEIDVV